ncbi:MAG TPA: hypothetical protein VIF40_18150 [Methylosinus sp.]|jgi:hypothetical protein|uniref:hypothetical protein n=1 Tax=Methylosinus sp. TaxID=427 RepID=UPI002F92DC22
MLGIGMNISSANLSKKGNAAFDPLTATPIAVWDIRVLSSLWQDAAGTIPVTADSDPVGRVDDLSGSGNYLYQTTAASRPTFHTAGGLFWLAYDGVDDQLLHSIAVAGAFAAAVEIASLKSSYTGLFATGAMMMLAKTGAGSGGKWGTHTGVVDAPAGSALSVADRCVLMMDGAASGAFYRNDVADGSYSATNGQSPAHLGGFNPVQATGMKFFGGIFKAGSFGANRSPVNKWLGRAAGLSL